MSTGPTSRRPGPPAGEPEVHAFDEQDSLAVDVAHLQVLAGEVLRSEGVRGQCELTLLFVDEPTIAELNARFMDSEGPTDVLAFPIDDDLAESGRYPDNGSTGPDRPPAELGDVPMLLGDVLVCPAVAARNAAEHGRSVEDELALLVVHGVLHVLGMDHAIEEDEAAMQAKERDLLARFHQT